MIDFDAARADTPGAASTVFLDSAGASLLPNPVLDEVFGHLRREAEVGGYRAQEERAEDLRQGYSTFARLLGAQPNEVAFTDSATRSWLSLVDAVPLGTGDEVLISEVEYGANAVALLRLAERTGATIRLVASDETGQLSLDALRAALSERVKLVSLVHMPTNSGLVNPVREVVDAAHEVGALVLLDACQSVGQLPVRVDELGVDLLSGTGRKWLRGPRGTGFLVVREAVADQLVPRLIDHSAAPWVSRDRYQLRDDARRHELWEYGVAERLGLIRAAEYAAALGIEAIAKEVDARARFLRDGLAELPGVRLRDLGRQHSGIVTFTVDGLGPDQVRDALRAAGITLTVSPGTSTLIDMTARGLSAVVRASPHYFVGFDELTTFLAAVGALPRS